MSRPEEQPLRFAFPERYAELLSELGKANIHSFDVQAHFIEKEKAFEVLLRFGDSFDQVMSKSFSKDIFGGKSEDVIAFFKEATGKVQQTIMTEYYKMMKS